jgi:hypothetical protein
MASTLYKIQLSWNDVIPSKRRVRASKKDAKPKLKVLPRRKTRMTTIAEQMELRRKLV